MARMNKEQLARLDGMQFALRIAEATGIGGLRREVQFRGANNVSLSVSRQELIGVAREMAKLDFGYVGIALAATVSQDMHWPLSVTHDFLAGFNRRIEQYRLNPDKAEKDSRLIESDTELKNMTTRFMNEELTIDENIIGG